MALLNENLIRAMVWDLKEVVSVSTVLSSWMGKIDCMSWRYPSKQSQSVDVLSIFNKLHGSAGEYYIHLLEFIYDRLLLILNLFIKFVENFPHPLDNCYTTKNVIHPQHLSLGGLLNIFWSRMQSLQTSMIDYMATHKSEDNVGINSAADKGNNSSASYISHTVVSRNCQTDLISLTSCENCYISEELMGKLITWLEHTALDLYGKSSVATQRQAMAEEITHTTQWSSVTRWASAIVDDLNALLASFKEANVTNTTLTKLLRTAEKKWDRKLCSYQECIKELEAECKDLKQKLVLKGNELSDFNEQYCRAISDKETTYNILEKKMQIADTMLAESVTKEKRTLKHLEKLQRQLDAAVVENNELENQVSELHSVQEQQQRREAKYSEAELLAASLQVENAALKASVARLEQRVSELERRESVLLKGNPIKARLQGNPAEDMLAQVRANEASIERLQAENTRLARTLHKLHAFQAGKK